MMVFARVSLPSPILSSPPPLPAPALAVLLEMVQLLMVRVSLNDEPFVDMAPPNPPTLFETSN